MVLSDLGTIILALYWHTRADFMISTALARNVERSCSIRLVTELPTRPPEYACRWLDGPGVCSFPTSLEQAFKLEIQAEYAKDSRITELYCFVVRRIVPSNASSINDKSNLP